MLLSCVYMYLLQFERCTRKTNSNVIIRRVEENPTFGFTPKIHMDIVLDKFLWRSREQCRIRSTLVLNASRLFFIERRSFVHGRLVIVSVTPTLRYPLKSNYFTLNEGILSMVSICQILKERCSMKPNLSVVIRPQYVEA